MKEISYKRGRYTVVINMEDNNKDTINHDDNIDGDGLNIEGKVIAFTGRGAYSRGTLIQAARKCGGIISSNTVTKDTDILFVGMSPGSKLQRAKLFGIKVLPVEDFIKIGLANYVL